MMKNLILAEDDEDDYLLFQEALKGGRVGVGLEWVRDGDELMRQLRDQSRAQPDMVFLDINMPCRNGFECLSDIRQDETLKQLPVIIYSTSNDPALVSWMYNSGANLFLCKPTEFGRLKAAIHKALEIDWARQAPYPPIGEFMLVV